MRWQNPALQQREREDRQKAGNRARRSSIRPGPQDQPAGGSQRGRRRPAQPVDQNIVAGQQPPTLGLIPSGRWPVPGDDFVDVGRRPPRSREIKREQPLFRPDEQQLAESADRQESRAPYDSGTGQEAEYAGAWQLSTWQRAFPHGRVDWIWRAGRSDEGARGNEPDFGKVFQHRYGPMQRPRFPPRVIIAERDVRSRRDGYADIAGAGPPVPWQRDHLDLGVPLPDCFRRAVGGCIVDYHDSRLLRQLGKDG